MENSDLLEEIEKTENENANQMITNMPHSTITKESEFSQKNYPADRTT